MVNRGRFLNAFAVIAWIFAPAFCHTSVLNVNRVSSTFAEVERWDAIYSANPKLASGPLSQPWEGVGYNEIRHALAPHLNSDVHVLVLGCGDSSIPEDLSDDGAGHVTAVDFSAVVVAAMDARNRQLRPGIKWLVGDITDLKLKDNSFAIAIDVGALDTVALAGDGGLRDAVSHVHRVLRPHGVFLSVSSEAPVLRQNLFSVPFTGSWLTTVLGIPRSRTLDPRIFDFDPAYRLQNLSLYINEAFDVEEAARRMSGGLSFVIDDLGTIDESVDLFDDTDANTFDNDFFVEGLYQEENLFRSSSEDREKTTSSGTDQMKNIGGVTVTPNPSPHVPSAPDAITTPPKPPVPEQQVVEPAAHKLPSPPADVTTNTPSPMPPAPRQSEPVAPAPPENSVVLDAPAPARSGDSSPQRSPEDASPHEGIAPSVMAQTVEPGSVAGAPANPSSPANEESTGADMQKETAAKVPAVAANQEGKPAFQEKVEEAKEENPMTDRERFQAEIERRAREAVAKAYAAAAARKAAAKGEL